MISYDMRAKNPAVVWREMPTMMRMDFSDAGRARLLYAWLHTMGMDEAEESLKVW